MKARAVLWWALVSLWVVLLLTGCLVGYGYLRGYNR